MENYTCYSDNLGNKLKNNSEDLFKEVLDQLLLKDNLINELQGQILSEREETKDLKKTISNLETKLASVNEEISVMNEMNSSQVFKNKTVSFDKMLNTNINENHNTIMSNDNSNQKFQTSSGINFNHNLDYLKLIEDKNELEIKHNQLEKELNAVRYKNKSITEIEDIYKKQLENNKKKIEYLEKNSKKIQEKEEYFEELIKRYNNLEKENQNIIKTKDIEIREISEQIAKKNEEIDKLRQSSDNHNADLLRELRALEEKNRESELKLLKIESIYREEIKKLQKIISETQNQIEINNNNSAINNNNKTPSSIALNVDDLATSFTKSIKEKIESQNKKISSQNIEILSLQYDQEKLQSELKYEREMCDKLQKTLAEYKYNRNKSDLVEKEEAQVQTVLKGEDIESAKMKNKILDENLSKMSESYEGSQKICRSYEERNKKMSKEILERELEVDLLKKKLDKLNRSEKIVERETLNNVSNNSKLNLTISLLKKRENELLERVQFLENNSNAISSSNNANEYNMKLMPRNINQHNDGIENRDEMNLRSGNNSHLENNREDIEACNNADSLIISADSNMYQMPNSNVNHARNSRYRQNLNSNASNSFYQAASNLYTYKNENVSNNSHNTFAYHGKDLLCDRYELELKKMQEDNFYLREQSFKLISDVNRLSESLKFYKSNFEEANSDRDHLYSEKEKVILDYELAISNLQTDLEKSKNINKEQIEDLRNKLSALSDVNSNMNEQLKSLQNKFYVQSQLIQEKNHELMNEKNSNQSLKIENSEILKDFETLQEKSKKTEKELNIFKTQTEKYKKDNIDLKQALNEINSRNCFAINEMEERSKILQGENQNLKEISNKIKIKLNEMYEENKQKESKLITLLKEENNELESRMIAEINELRIENENLSKERSDLKVINNELKYENGMLRDQIGQVSEMNKSILATKEKFQSNPTMNKKLSSTENELKNLREENFRLKNRLEEFSNKLMQNEKSFNIIKIDFQSSEIEKQRLSDKVKAKEEEILILKSDLKYKNENSNNSSNLEQLLNEINTKNQTINYLIDEVEVVKKETKQRLLENENILCDIKEEKENLSKNLIDIKEDFEKYKRYSIETISDLKKENEILLQDVEEKEKERDGIIIEKSKLENEFYLLANKFEENKKISEEKILRLGEENNFLSEKVEELTHNSIEKFNKLHDKNLRSKSKISSLIKVYETHIKLLKERFENILNDFSLMMNVKINSLSNKELTDKFLKLFKNLENSVDLQSKISEREALVENAKSEIKIMKTNLANAKSLQTKLTKENEELKELFKVKKLQMKIAEKEHNTGINQNLIESKSYKLLIRMDDMEKIISDLEIKDSNSKVKLKTSQAEVKLISDDNHFIKETNRNLLSKNTQLEEELTRREKEITELNKSHRLEIVKIIDELRRIKERWIQPEKQLEYLSQIEELEKTVKNLKEDLNRKRELIGTLKVKDRESSYNFIGNNANINNPNTNINGEKISSTNLNDNSSFNSLTALEDKIKALNKEVTRKDNLIKDLRANIDTLKQNEKKNIDEISSLTEKSKINKIEISRKEAIIKEYKEKMKEISNDSNNEILSKTNEEFKDSNKKLRSEIERKEAMIKTIKAKLEASNLEVEQLRNLNIKLSKSTSAEADREQKQQELIRIKLDVLSSQNENFASFVRRIFKELIAKYERLRSKANILSGTNKNSMREGLDILGVSQDELEEYLNPTEKNQNLFNNINKILEGDNIQCEVILNLYNGLNDKISNLEKQLKINMINSNNFDYTGEKWK